MDTHFINGGVKPVTGEFIKKQLNMPAFDDADELIAELCGEAAKLACPKAVYMKAEIEELGEDYIIAGGFRITSELVRKNTGKCSFILPYTATCGRELHDWAKQYDNDLLAQYIADAIKELYLRRICGIMAKQAKDSYYPESDISSMAPGSLDAEWPITQQKQLFRLLGENAVKIGVELTQSCLMIPSKSVSGFYFSADGHFENCMLCTRLSCPNRRAPYKPKE